MTTQHQQPTGQGLRPRIHRCGAGALTDIHRLHAELVIGRGLLLSLIDPGRERRARAREDLARRGGFLHAPLELDAQSLHRNVALAAVEGGSLLGYCTALTHPADVEAHCARFFGWSGSRRYRTAADLPRTSSVGDLEWTDPARTISALNRLGRLAVAPEMAVRKQAGRQELSGADLLGGLASALSPGSAILGEIFAVEGIDGVPVDPPVHNVASERCMERLGGARIGFLRERFRRHDGVEVAAAWGLWLLDVDGLPRSAGRAA